MKAFVSTHPFGSVSREPLDVLDQAGVEVELNPYGRTIKPDELVRHLRGADALIAGTERLDRATLDAAPRLAIIARVGIGLDGIDFDAVRERGIRLTYTPDAVSRAVAELTVANMVNLARSIPQVHLAMKGGRWTRPIGFELAGKTVGIVGFGRVGRLVARLLEGFGCTLLASDVAPDEEAAARLGVRLCDTEELLATADIVTLHVPLTPLTAGLLDARALARMKPTACLINTSRGHVVDEDDLFDALAAGHIAAAALDVYETEPYAGGRLCELDNVLLTCHSGSCSAEGRRLMELGAATEVARLARGEPALCPVTDETIAAERAAAVTPINAEWRPLVERARPRDDERYRVHRRRWSGHPAFGIAGPYPLAVDVELVCNPASSGSRRLERSISAASAATRFMEMPLFEAVVRELRGIGEPTAITLGFRGDPLYHPEIGRAIAGCRDAGSIETTLTTTHLALGETQAEALVAGGLDVLNLVVEASADGEAAGEVIAVIQRLRRLRLARKREAPMIRILAEVDRREVGRLSAFVDYWTHWADAVGVVDPEASASRAAGGDAPARWTCSRLWQRLVVAHDGALLCCNFDIHEQGRLGRFPETGIGEAWRGAAMTALRDLHRTPNARLPEPCLSCPFRATELRKLRG